MRFYEKYDIGLGGQPEGYSVSVDGKVVGPRGWEIKQWVSNNGYLRVAVHQNGEQYTLSVHTLVCRKFHGVPPSPRHQVRHLDGCKENNHASNLIWGTPEENYADRQKHGTSNEGKQNGRSLLTESQVLEIRRRYGYGKTRQRDLADVYGVSQTRISQIVLRKQWRNI